MIAKFTPVDPEKWTRKEYFDYYYNTIKCKYTLNANIDITIFQQQRVERNIKFFPAFLYTIVSAINQNEEFRMSFEQGELGHWNYVVPSYTIFHEDDKTFSDIWSEYSSDFPTFYDTVLEDIETYKEIKGIKPKGGQPKNFCPISSIPWLHFTSFSQDTFSESSMLFPLIKFGKYLELNGKIEIPVAIFVNHAIADGFHTCKLINDIQEIANNTTQWMKI